MRESDEKVAMIAASVMSFSEIGCFAGEHGRGGKRHCQLWVILEGWDGKARRTQA